MRSIASELKGYMGATAGLRDEKESLNREQTFFASCRASITKDGESGSKNRQGLWHADLCVGKRQGCRQETVTVRERLPDHPWRASPRSLGHDRRPRV